MAQATALAQNAQEPLEQTGDAANVAQVPVPMSGLERTAVLLLSLGEEHGKDLWEQLSEEEVSALSLTMTKLGKINIEMIESTLKAFIADMSISGAVLGSFETTENLLKNFLPEERVKMIMETIRGPAGRNMWEKLSNVQPHILANYLQNEYPQTAAVILSKINPEHAAAVLPHLQEDFAMDIVQRMLAMESVQKEILENIEQTLRTEFMANLSSSTQSNSFEIMANIFNHFDRQTEAQFMARLDGVDRNAADEIKNLMFTFEDLKVLEKSAIQKILRDAPNDALGLALKGASEELTDLIIGNMSQRAGAMLRDDMENMGPVRLKDVDEAQAVLVNVAKELAEKGDIVMNKNGDDDEYIS